MNERQYWDGRLADYLRWRREQGKAEGTIDDDKAIVGQWIRYTLDQSVQPDEIDEELLHRWVAAHKNLAPDSQNSYRAHVKPWWRWNRDFPAARDADIGEQEQYGGAAMWMERLKEYEDVLRSQGLAEKTIRMGHGKRKKWIKLTCETGRDPGVWDDSAFEEYFDKHETVETRRQRQAIQNHIKKWCDYWSGRGDAEQVSCWVVRAGREGEAVEYNLANGVVTIGWGGVPEFAELAHCESREEFRDLIDERLPDWAEKDKRSAREQIWRFAREIESGDLVVTPLKGMEPGGNSLAIGRVEGPYEFELDEPDDMRQRRSVTWLRTGIERDAIGEDLRNSIDTPMTVFGLRRHDAARRIRHLAEHGVDPGAGSARRRLADALDEAVERLGKAATHLLCRKEFLRDVVALLEDKGQVILYGPPGSGKTYFARHLAWTLLGIADDDEYEDNPPYSLVQFHPAYSYEDFFEGFRPRVDDDGQMTYKLTPGPLVRLAERAADHPDELHVMVIDEINRANLPRVLGELLYLLEYRDDWAQTQYRPDDGFELPSNLWIIGTMNTADRSIALIDAAMRRRFHFVPFFPDREPTAGLLRRWCERNEPGQVWIADLLDAVNERLRDDLGGDYMLIGPSHFMKSDLDENGLRRIWEYNIEPLIEDQFFGRQEVIDSYRFGEVWKRHGHGAAGPASEMGTSDGTGDEAEPGSDYEEGPQSDGDW